jgi:hypothetical protein
MKIKNWVACVQDRGKWKDDVEKAKTFNPPLKEVQRLEQDINICFINNYLQTCCHVTNGYNKNNYHLLTHNFSKEQCTVPEDDLRIETCKSFLNILM